MIDWESVKMASVPLAVSLLGVILAWLQQTYGWLLPLAIVIAMAAVGWLTIRYGRSCLPCNPQKAQQVLEFGVLLEFAIAGAIAAILIGVAVYAVGNNDMSTETKKIIAAVASAVTIFLSTVFLKPLEDEWPGAAIIRQSFRNAYNDPVLQKEEYKDLRIRIFTSGQQWDLKGRRQLAADLQAIAPTLSVCQSQSKAVI